MFAIIEKVAPDTAWLVFSSALNKHLGTEGLNIAEIAAEAASRDMSVEDVMAIPEQDGWEY